MSPGGQALGAVHMTSSFLRKFFGAGFSVESWLTSCSVFRQTASMEAEIDCKMPSNSR